MLVNEFLETFTELTPVATSDGEGGTTTVWMQGDKFLGAAVKGRMPEMIAAERAGEAPEYTLTISATTPVKLAYHDVVKRDSDGMVFRMTSSTADSRPPKCATFDFLQVRCELWQLP